MSEVFDRDAFFTHVGDDQELVCELASIFLQDYPTYLARIRDAVVQGDAQALQRAAHTLKGSVANFAAHASFEASRRVEELGRAGELSGAEAALAHLERELARLRVVLSGLAGAASDAGRSSA